jgi:hypothetical protein
MKPDLKSIDDLLNKALVLIHDMGDGGLPRPLAYAVQQIMQARDKIGDLAITFCDGSDKSLYDKAVDEIGKLVQSAHNKEPDRSASPITVRPPEYIRAAPGIHAITMSRDKTTVECHPESSISLVLNERLRQIHIEKFDAKNDDMHTNYSLARAAVCYAVPPKFRTWDDRLITDIYWPWGPGVFKPTTWRRDLVKAGALILAELDRIERLDRAAHPNEPLR